MIYRGPGFPRFYDLAPRPPSPLPDSKLAQWHTGRLTKRDNLLTGEGGGWAEYSYDGEKAWSSVNYLILSDVHICFFHSLPHKTFFPTQFSIFMTLQQGHNTTGTTVQKTRKVFSTRTDLVVAKRVNLT
jgi:hypothetical protein